MYKVIRTGHITEIYHYDTIRRKTDEQKETDKAWKEIVNQTETEQTDQEKKQANREHNLKQIKLRIKRLISANFSRHSVMATFTFRENILEVETANRHFKTFIQRMRYVYGNEFKYLAIIEFQERGAVHYHTLFDIPYIPQQDLIKLWSLGGVDIRDIKQVDNIGAYLSVYLTKEVETRLMGKKAYLYSRNLDKPTEELTENIPDDVLELKPVYTKIYQTEYNGICRYWEYNNERRG